MSAVVPTALTVIRSVLLASLTYWLTQAREREAELRREKLELYKAFTSSLSGVLEGEASPEGQRAFSRACNNLLLLAPQNVIGALRRF